MSGLVVAPGHSNLHSPGTSGSSGQSAHGHASTPRFVSSKKIYLKNGKHEKNMKASKKNTLFMATKLQKHPVLQKLVLHGSDAVLEDVAVLRLAEAGHIAL